MNKSINIGIPSKGRLKKSVLEIFKNKKLKLISLRGARDLFASIKKLPKLKSGDLYSLVHQLKC